MKGSTPSSIEFHKESSFEWGIVGLGYVGLPLAVEAARSGLRVVGLDIDEAIISMLASGASHIEDISDGDLGVALEDGLEVSSQLSALSDCDAVSICVPTPWRGNEPDLTFVEDASKTVGRHLGQGQLIVLESTTYPGTTEEVVLPILERESGLVAGEDFHLAYSPERIDPGNDMWRLKNTPKLVAGIDEASSIRAEALYGKVCNQIVVLGGTREAEMAKLLENTYRLVNIALVNEMAVFCRELGVDIYEAIRGASTKPFGFMPFWPGAGVGGHCIPVDPGYLSYRVSLTGAPFRFVELAQDINARMAQYVVERVIRILSDAGVALEGSKVMLAGVAYKPDVGDVRETPALPIAELLLGMGTDVSYVDPHIDRFEVNGGDLPRWDNPLEGAGKTDMTIVITAHSKFDLGLIASVAVDCFDATGQVPPGLSERL